jgi:cation diffusion facilitator CzcD-associated flavoprotein CzcO
LECIADQDKCEVTFDPIKEITQNGVVTNDGTEHSIDVLICATGFDVSFRPKYPLCGKNGVDMADAWRDAPETYLSVTAPQFPNYFSQFPIKQRYYFTLRKIELTICSD